MALTELLQEGVRALQAGDREQAVIFFAQAVRESRQSEEAWLYLGLALDDPTRKRQAYEQVLKLNPANEKARLQLAKMGISTNPPKLIEEDITAGSSLVESTGSFRIVADEPQVASSPKASGPTARERINSVFTTPIRMPFAVEGAPPMVTLGGLVSKWTRTALGGLRQLVTGRLPSLDEATPQSTWWDVVLPMTAGAFIFSAAEFVGKLIYGISILDIGGILVTPIFAALLSFSVVVVGLLVGGYVGQLYLENQKSSVELRGYLSYYANVVLGALTAEAILRVLGYIFMVLLRLEISTVRILVTMISIFLAVFVGFLLYRKWQTYYGLPENAAIIGTVLTVGSGWLIIRILLVVLGAIFRIWFF